MTVAKSHDCVATWRHVSEKDGWQRRASGNARILGDNEGCRINILGTLLPLSLFSSPSFSCSTPLVFSMTTTTELTLRSRRLVRQIVIATASLITGFCVLVPTPNGGFAREGILGTVVTIVHRYCPVIPGDLGASSMSCRTYSLTLDTSFLPFRG